MMQVATAKGFDMLPENGQLVSALLLGDIADSYGLDCARDVDDCLQPCEGCGLATFWTVEDAAPLCEECAERALQDSPQVYKCL